MGSPPRMRGKERKRCCTATGTGITPAYAGKRMAIYTTVQGDTGSPPHMRGKDVVAWRQSAEFRITPAYAGKRSTHKLSMAIKKDHPRICGEKEHPQAEYGYKEGSPPHMRGKANRYGSPVPPLGITPAYAGKSKSAHFIATRRQDHPRICGEKYPRYKRR